MSIHPTAIIHQGAQIGGHQVPGLSISNVTKRRLVFGIPSALTSQVALRLDQAEADVDFPGAISFKRILTGDKTGVEAVMGSADRVELLWTPRVKRVADMEATIFCDNSAGHAGAGAIAGWRRYLGFEG